MRFVLKINGVDVSANPLEAKRVLAYLPDNPDLYNFLSGIQYLNFIADIFGVEKSVRAERIRRLRAAGYDYESVQYLVNGLSKGYGRVAEEVIDGKYGNGTARIKALTAAGFDAEQVQAIVNGILLK